MSDDRKFQTFEEFWPFYIGEHSHPVNRALHFLGTTAAMAVAARAVLRGKPAGLLLAPLCGYGAAWIGHFVVEKNRPATFTYPLWSLRGDFKMWWKIATGAMDAEIEAARRASEAPAEPAAAAAPGDSQAWN